MATPFSSVRRWHRWWFIPLNLLALLLVLAFLWFALLQSTVSQLRDSGAPVVYADLVADSIPDAENVAAGLRDLGPTLERGGNAAADALEALGETPYDDTGIAEARRVYDEQSTTIGELHSILSRPQYVSLLKADEMANLFGLPTMSTARSAARLLLLEGRLALVSGDQDKAVEAALALARLGKLYENEPIIVNRLLSCALQNMAINLMQQTTQTGPLPAHLSAQLDEALASLEDRSGFQQALASERAHSLEIFQTMSPIVRLWEQPAVLEAYEQTISAAEKEFAKPGPGGPSPKMTSQQALASLLLPSFESAWDAENRIAEDAKELRERLEAASQ
ncbi:hypothetical protein [Botrimarina mediterranea]|uniref:Uncharacterized protein n=1 Tax=Botrimarina mediterranea TaxID=2528022 RepID=A0A518K2J9_9BACT|nr:hypothetical protein [Botrimarina mediterranea]QDV72012.1 hypothetical protein Spa11_01820 [Botrimarina mediterranea]QDV76553.1 hypothetical protein K2D_01320 [Planctomycetes bacterium K2D]